MNTRLMYATHAQRRIAGTRVIHLAEWTDSDRERWLRAKESRQDYGGDGWIGPYTDTATGDVLDIRPSSCGFGCYCAAEWRVRRKFKPRAVKAPAE